MSSGATSSRAAVLGGGMRPAPPARHTEPGGSHPFPAGPCWGKAGLPHPPQPCTTRSPRALPWPPAAAGEARDAAEL